MSFLTVFTGGVITWQFNNQEITFEDQKMIDLVKQEMEKSPIKYVVVKYNIDWQNDDTALVSGKTIFNIPVVSAKVGK